jgi:hypothetical protein
MAAGSEQLDTQQCSFILAVGSEQLDTQQ